MFRFIRFKMCSWEACSDFRILVSSCAGKVINLRRLDNAISSINDWYMERGLFAMVCSSA